MVAIVVSLIGWAATATALYRRAASAESRAITAGIRAEDHLRDLETHFADLLTAIARLEAAPGTETVRNQLLAEAYHGLRKLMQTQLDDRSSPARLAALVYQLGDLASNLGRHADALDCFQRAVAIRETLASDHPDNLDYRSKLSVTIVRAGNLLGRVADYDGERKMYESALVIDSELTKAAPDDAHFHDNLAWSFGRLGELARKRGEFDDAEALFQEQLAAAQRAVTLEPWNPVRLDTLQEAQAQQAPPTSDAERSLNSAGTRLTAAQGRVACNPGDAAAHESLIAARNLVSFVSMHSHRRAEAFHGCVDTARRAMELDSDSPHRMRRFVARLQDYAYATYQAGLEAEADSAASEAIALAEGLVRSEPRYVENQKLLAGLHGWMAGCADRRGDPDGALAHASAALRHRELAAESSPASDGLICDVFCDRHAIIHSLLQCDRPSEAWSNVVSTIAFAERSLADGRLNSECQRYYGKFMTEPDAMDFRDIDRGLGLMESTNLVSRPGDPVLWEELGNAAAAAGRMDQACAAWDRALKLDVELDRSLDRGP